MAFDHPVHLLGDVDSVVADALVVVTDQRELHRARKPRFVA
jgi:hypothetical protein